MAGIFSYFFHPLPNAIMSILLGLSVIYWLLTFLSGTFLGDLDFGVDSEADMNADIANGETSVEPSMFSKILAFINIGKVPIMLVISVFEFIGWLLSLASSMIWNISEWGIKSALILIPIFIITYFLTRFATKPFVKIYKSMGYSGEERHDLIGRNAIMKSAIQDDKIGNAELVILNDVIRIMVKSKDGLPIDYNTEVIIVDESPDRKFYWVAPEINLNNF